MPHSRADSGIASIMAAAELLNAATHAPFKVALKRTPFLSEYHASFIVPLWFSKLDLRDYLFHAYNLPIGPSIRSYVKQSRIRQGSNPDLARPQYKRWHRPRNTKHMTVELESPFVWPDAPKTEEEYRPWNRAEVKKGMEENMEVQERMSQGADQKGVSHERRTAMREQAKALLEGRERWKPGMNRGAGIMHGR
ncbi:hypothetical protein D0869_01958 [Hortaea werneckii]|uniref:Uncharacterized protein n=1 Tax=Hortaea werneckii TaxID=91943 RepID=A0A3M6XB19_HORWE|nr:hypothetical protein D0869_01958 [Hortaea werneckii]